MEHIYMTETCQRTLARLRADAASVRQAVQKM